MIITVKAKRGNGWHDINGYDLEVIPLTDEIIKDRGKLLADKDAKKYYLAVDSPFNRKLLDGLKNDSVLGKYSTFVSWAETYIFRHRTALIHRSYVTKHMNEISVNKFKGTEERYD